MVKVFVQNVVINCFIFVGLMLIISKDNIYKILNLEKEKICE